MSTIPPPDRPPSTIKVFLADGAPEGLWLVTKQNWTGIALRFSRNTYKDVRARSEFDRPGVYVLAGDPMASEHQREIYVGEAGIVRDRLNNHLPSQQSSQRPGLLDRGRRLRGCRGLQTSATPSTSKPSSSTARRRPSAA